MAERIEAVVFDLDKTLVDSDIDFAEMRKRIQEYLGSIHPDLAKAGDASTTMEIIAELEKIGDGGRLSEEMKEIHRIMDDVEMASASKARPLCDVGGVISDLKSIGLKVGLLTRSCERYATTVIEKAAGHHFLELFDAVSCRGFGRPIKPDPRSLIQLADALGSDTRQVLVVGDHLMDGRCAAEAGALFAAVTYGSSPSSDLKDLSPIFLLNDLSELPEAIEGLAEDRG